MAIEVERQKRLRIGSTVTLAGTAAVTLGLFLPWGQVRGTTVDIRSHTMIGFALALCASVVLGLLVAVQTLARQRVGAWARVVGVFSVLDAAALAVLLPAGISLGDQASARPIGDTGNVTFETGAWAIAVGLTLLLAGLGLVLTSRRLATVAAMLAGPVAFGAVLVIELR
jgi:hypothetical protein